MERKIYSFGNKGSFKIKFRKNDILTTNIKIIFTWVMVTLLDNVVKNVTGNFINSFFLKFLGKHYSLYKTVSTVFSLWTFYIIAQAWY